MHVEINCKNDYKRFELEEAAHWVADKLMSKRLHKNIYLEIELVSNLKKESNAIGFSEITGDNWRPRDFKIVLDSKLSNRATIRTLMHEMVHIKQWSRGELKEITKPECKTLWFDEDHTETEYQDQPWEIEAYVLQEPLADAYIKMIKSEI